jgi:hypothetical protein
MGRMGLVAERSHATGCGAVWQPLVPCKHGRGRIHSVLRCDFFAKAGWMGEWNDA